MKRVTTVVFTLAIVMSLTVINPIHAASDLDNCKSQKLNAAGLYVKKLLYCYRAAVKAGSVDPDPICLQEAETQFMTRWENAEKSSEECAAVTAPLQELMDDILTEDGQEGYVYDIVEAILAGEDGIAGTDDDLDLTDKHARNLGASLLKAAALMSFDLLKAYSKDIKKPNDKKFGKRERKAGEKFRKTWGKAFRKAEKKGYVYGGVTLDEIEALIETMVAGIVSAIDPPE